MKNQSSYFFHSTLLVLGQQGRICTVRTQGSQKPGYKKTWGEWALTEILDTLLPSVIRQNLHSMFFTRGAKIYVQHVLCHSLYSQCPLPSFLYHPFTSCPSLLPSISSLKTCSPYCLSVPSIYTITSFCPSIPFIHSNFVLHRSIHSVLLFSLCLTSFHLSKLSANIFPPSNLSIPCLSSIPSLNSAPSSYPNILSLHSVLKHLSSIFSLHSVPPSKTVSYASILHLKEAQNTGTFTHGKISMVFP